MFWGKFYIQFLILVGTRDAPDFTSVLLQSLLYKNGTAAAVHQRKIIKKICDLKYCKIYSVFICVELFSSKCIFKAAYGQWEEGIPKYPP